MMLTQQLSVLAHDLAKQCQVTGQSKPEERTKRFNKKSRHHSIEAAEDTTGTKMEDRKITDFYKIGVIIGHGGFGAVYAGTCTKTGISVAIKVLARKKVVSWSKIRDRVVPKEVALLHNLQQDYIIKMLDFFEEDDKFYIVMERPEKYIDLFDYISQRGTVSERSSRYFFQQVLEAVQYCLSKGIVHRDVKDENILIDLKSYQVKLIDFGSGTFLRDSIYTEYEGTPVYCPPEWLLKKGYHAIPATVWSLGILLYNMLLGDVPFEEKEEIALAQLTFHITISKDAESLIRWMLSFSPQDRPTIEQVLNHPWLKGTANSSSSSSSRTSHLPKTSNGSLSSSGSYLSYSSSSCSYHKSPYYHSQARVSPQHQVTFSASQSSRLKSRAPASPHPAPATFISPIQTRSRSRLNQTDQGCPPASGRHNGCPRTAYEYGSPANSTAGTCRTPQLPTQKSRHQGSQVTGKK